MFDISFGHTRRNCILSLACVLAFATLGHAQNDGPDLGQLGLDQLAKVQVTSVSKKEQKLGDVAAAAYVISQEDIRNSAATTIPDLLRIVPGLDVAQISGGWWVVSSRGFGSQFGQDMLVLIDGRSVFDPLFSGVLWNEQDLMLEDIERIEIIRGPGVVMWGSNAFNGVINIITKPAQETQGGLMSTGIDNDARPFAEIRYGGKVGRSTSYRVYSKYYDQAPNRLVNGSAHDSTRGLSGGFRIDTVTSESNSFMLEGKAFNNGIGLDLPGLSYTAPFSFNYVDQLEDEGENFLARWIHKSSDGSTTSAQLTFAHAAHHQLVPVVNGNLGDLSVQHERAAGKRHDLVFGVEYEFREATTSTALPTVSWAPSNPSVKIASGFIQDEVLFANGAIHFTTGLRLDYNGLSGFALNPTARLLWKVNQKHSFWVAYSLANRTSSADDAYIQNNIAIFPGSTGLQALRIVGNPNLKAEKQSAFELGYRVQWDKRVSVDVAGFYNRYFDLIGEQFGQPLEEAGPPARTVLPLIDENNTAGGAFGAELAAQWSPTSTLHFGTAYSLFELALAQSAPFAGDQAQIVNGTTPRHELNLRTALDLRRNLTWSSTARFVDRRTVQAVPGYTEVDATLQWSPFESGEFKMGVNNFLNKEHMEFSSPIELFTEMGRTFYGKMTWRF